MTSCLKPAAEEAGRLPVLLPDQVSSFAYRKSKSGKPFLNAL